MRIVFGWTKSVLSGLLSLSIVAAFLCGVYMLNACKLRAIDGERVFYLHSASSQGLRKEELTLQDFSKITGESVRFSHDGEEPALLAEEVVSTYAATVLFVEETADTVSYYCYTDTWKNGLELNGVTVNLHVAVSKTECVVGTPIIFGGF